MIFSRYMARQVFYAVMQALGGLIAVVLLLDTLELIRRTGSKANVSFGQVIEMALLKTPEMAFRLLPFAVLIGVMVALTRMTRRSELVIARASGISVWQFLRPAWAVVFALGIFSVTVISPIASAMLARFEQLEVQHISGKASLLSVSESGLWVRDYEVMPDGNNHERIFHATRLDQNQMILREVILFRFDKEQQMVDRVNADSAQLQKGYWNLRGVERFEVGKPVETMPTLRLPTTLTIEQIQDSFASPETLSFWELSDFIEVLEVAGFSALRHKLHFQMMLALPFMLVAMVFIGATFSLRSPRRNGAVVMVVGGVISGFLIFFLSDIVHAMGLAGTLPILLAAWIPPLATLLTGIWLMLQFE